MLRYLNLISRVIAKCIQFLRSLWFTQSCAKTGPGPANQWPVARGKSSYSRILCGRMWIRNFPYNCVAMEAPHSRRIDLVWRSFHRLGTCFYTLWLAISAKQLKKEKKSTFRIISICLSSIFHKAQGEFEFFPPKLFSKHYILTYSEGCKFT